MTTLKEVCDSCGKDIAAYESVHLQDKQHPQLLCFRCFNRYAARRMGIDCPEPEIEDITLSDCRGHAHRFIIQNQLVPGGILIEAFEVKNGCRGGYEFGVLGDFDDDQLKLFAELFERMRRGLARKHIEEGEFGRRISTGDTVRGRITWDEEFDGRIPMLVIDGMEITWEELGRMLMSYEGFQFKLEIRDRSEEV
jgi:hypothetical protein